MIIRSITPARNDCNVISINYLSNIVYVFLMFSSAGNRPMRICMAIFNIHFIEHYIRISLIEAGWDIW